MSQVQPLRQLHTQDKNLQSAVDKLSSAYQKLYSSSGASSAKQAVSHATHLMNTICPGAAS